MFKSSAKALKEHSLKMLDHNTTIINQLDEEDPEEVSS